MGYHQAGFEVVGVDIQPRPYYPFEFHQANALDVLADKNFMSRFDAVAAGPPCQAKCALTVGTNASRGWGRTHVDLVARTRELLDATGLPYVIEQPDGRANVRKDVSLCGEMFGLGVIRHRNFELGRWTTGRPKHPRHRGYVRGWRHGVYRDGPYIAAYGKGGGKATEAEMQEAMRIHWTPVREELTEAIPPAYGRWLGERLMAHLAAGRAA